MAQGSTSPTQTQNAINYYNYLTKLWFNDKCEKKGNRNREENK